MPLSHVLLPRFQCADPASLSVMLLSCHVFAFVTRCALLPSFFLCKGSPDRALQVPVTELIINFTKFQHAFRIFFLTPCHTVAKENAVFPNFPCDSLPLALSLLGFLNARKN